MYINRRNSGKTTSDSSVSAFTETDHYSSIAGVPHQGDVVSSQNEYQTLQHHHLQLPLSRNSAAPYVELIPTPT